MVDSKAQAATLCTAMDFDEHPRPKGDLASLLAAEMLDPYSHEELSERIRLLEVEIARVIAHREKAQAHRAAADLLFKAPPPDGTAR